MATSFLTCRACLARTVQLAACGTTTSKGSTETASRMTSAAAHLGRQPRARGYATAVSVPVTDAERPVDAPSPRQAPDGDVAALQKKQRQKLQRAVKKHLAHMDDPWKIAQHVEQTLQKNRFDEALLLTQQSSKDGQVVVAWNHLIGYQLERQQLKQAIKLFNDASTMTRPLALGHTKHMKKRGQLPNVQTFTIIFRGCAKAKHAQTAVAEAIKHYNLLLADKRIQPNSIHLNAVLNVCARAGDLDSMFLIADTANDSTRAPTAYTYTTILNALRHDAIKDMPHLSPQQQAANLQKAIDRSRGLWVEVMEKWNQGRVLVDEELVCAMGRVLLLAPKREDKRRVLHLLHQTMGIPDLSKDAETSPPRGDAAADGPRSAIAGAVPDNNNNKDDDGSNRRPRSDANINTTTTAAPVSARQKALYAVPGRNTLALLLTTLASTRLTTSGIKYWNLLDQAQGQGILYNNKREVVALARLMFSSFNKVINEKMLPDKELRRLRHVGAKINREIQSFYSNREELEPKLRRSSAASAASAASQAEPLPETDLVNATQSVPERHGGDFVWDTTKSGDPVSRRSSRR
ncbi:hypothetical protein E4U53_003292 [Claviceps sorghi]|nr:hypothetical protein E4U53_003292 [Claviceps sorghi]